MILLIDAGGMRSSALFAHSTVPVSASSISGCRPSVSSPPVGGGAVADGAPGFGLAGPGLACAGLVWAAWPVTAAASGSAKAATSVTAGLHRYRQNLIDSPRILA